MAGLLAEFVNQFDQQSYVVSTVKPPVAKIWESGVFAKEALRLFGNRPIVRFHWLNHEAKDGHTALSQVLAILPREKWEECAVYIEAIFAGTLEDEDRENVRIHEYLDTYMRTYFPSGQSSVERQAEVQSESRGWSSMEGGAMSKDTIGGLNLASVFIHEHDHKRYFVATDRHEPTGVLATLVVETNFFGGPKNFRKPVARFLWQPDANAKEMHDGVVETLTHLHPLTWPVLMAKANPREP